MSADNWRPCPVCERKEFAAIEKRRESLMSKYGVLSADEFAVLYAEIQADLTAVKMNAADQRLREDWELGIDDDGDFYISFRSSCTKCRTSWGYKVDGVGTNFSKAEATQ